MKAIVLLSGGLDSILATKLILDQGMDLEAVNFLTVFSPCTERGETAQAARKAAEAFGIPLKLIDISDEFLEIAKHPRHGYGSQMNPCIDCRILMLRKAKTHMESAGATFIVTGEVLGQRPMSQRKDAMRLTEKEAGLQGLVLRPLSARLLSPTLPEERGWVDREKLLGLSGRSRKIQMELADLFGIRDYPCPAGGCLLTDPMFARRLKDLMVHAPDFSLNDVHLLKFGRHFRLAPHLKLIVGRSEGDNEKIQTFAREGDVLIKAVDAPGPLSLLRGSGDDAMTALAGAITVRYGKARDRTKVSVLVTPVGQGNPRTLAVSPLHEPGMREWIIGD